MRRWSVMAALGVFLVGCGDDAAGDDSTTTAEAATTTITTLADPTTTSTLQATTTTSTAATTTSIVAATTTSGPPTPTSAATTSTLPPTTTTTAGTTTTSGGATYTVTVGNNGTSTFSPSGLTIAPGDTVRWLWALDSSTHTTTGGDWDSGYMSAGDSYSHTFPSAGSFSYVCTIHSSMTGTITVSG